MPSLIVAPARAACGGGDDGFAAPFVIEPGGENVAVIRVLRVYRGTADETVKVDPDVLGDCTAPTEAGERIMLAFIESSQDGSFVGSWHEDERRRWWHHFDRYRDVGGLIQALGAMLDTSVQPPAEGGGSSGLTSWLAAWAGLTAAALIARRRAIDNPTA